jgi:hypothetical protein
MMQSIVKDLFFSSSLDKSEMCVKATRQPIFVTHWQVIEIIFDDVLFGYIERVPDNRQFE